MQISSHLNLKPWQVAITLDLNLPFRKWYHMGTTWAVTARSAAFELGSVVKEEDGIYQLNSGWFVHVH